MSPKTVFSSVALVIALGSLEKSIVTTPLPIIGAELNAGAALTWVVTAYLMMSGGGLTTLELAARFPIRLVESGPAGGAILAAHLARECGLDKVLAFDMGGTTGLAHGAHLIIKRLPIPGQRMAAGDDDIDFLLNIKKEIEEFETLEK